MTPVHINFDDAWDPARVGMRTVDGRALGAALRYTAPEAFIQRAIDILSKELHDEQFILYGSGDYHFLAAWLLNRILDRFDSSALSKVTLLSFDNHPDWDIRSPRWTCGGWINRALELPEIARASVWGCGNFELGFPSRLFRNKRALADGTLEVHGWAERQLPKAVSMFNCMTRENWRARFTGFAEALQGQPVYVTLDLDALDAEHSVTNWENGLFTVDDVVWAMGLVRANARVIGVDCCGAFSPPRYARVMQRFMGKFDHPKIVPLPVEQARTINHQTLEKLLPVLVG